ncbi:MAG: iron ABC transporter permease [Rhodothermales bacterium]|nr:iron ABC transporter permease [Rhodothermales bacterium]
MFLVGRRTSIVLFVFVLAVLAGYVFWPALEVFSQGLRPSLIGKIFSSWRSANVRALVNSVAISVYSVAGAGVVGTFLAYLFYRFDFPLRRFMMGVAVLPLALPPLVGVLAFLFLYGESGILPRTVQLLLGLDAVPFSFDGLWAVWLVHVYTMYVYFYLFVASALRSIDGGLLEASADLGAHGFRTFVRVILPQLRPSLIGASLLVFMISMASFTAPLLFAGNDPFLTLQIFNYKTNGNLDLSAAVSCVLTIICLIFLLAIELGGRKKLHRTASKGVASKPTPVGKGLTRIFLMSGVALFLTLILLPIATIVLISLAETGSWTLQVIPERYTFENYAKLFSEPQILKPILNSLRMAGVATAANIVFGVAAGLLISKVRLRGTTLLRILTALPFAIPGTVIAVNLILTFNTPSPLSAGQVLVGTFWILPLAYFIRNIPLIVRATTAALDGMDDSLVEASADLGARPRMTFRRVVLPLILPGVLAGTLLTFVAALGEFVSSIMLYVYSNRPISVEILAQLRLFDFGSAAAYSVLLMIMVVIASLSTRLLSRGRSQLGEAFL